MDVCSGKKGLCYWCCKYTIDKYEIKNQKIIYKQNLTADFLKSLTIDELMNLVQMTRNGIQVCNSCHKLCKINDSDCSANDRKAFSKGGAYNLRLDVSNRDLNAISREVQRRENIQKVLGKMKK